MEQKILKTLIFVLSALNLFFAAKALINEFTTSEEDAIWKKS